VLVGLLCLVHADVLLLLMMLFMACMLLCL
jgi:hypothetical protein